jgi:hypothetical protein
VFLPQRAGPRPGSTYLHPDTERLLAEEIRRALKDSPDIAVDDLYRACPAPALIDRTVRFRRAGLSQREVAGKLGLDERTVRYWCKENGKIRPPQMAILALERLADLSQQPKD